MKSSIADSPLFSIVIPVYKARQYLHACLESIAAQSLDSFEVICVDDCSPDDSAKIVQEFSDSDSRFKLIRHKVNASPGAARNTGIREARGKWITFADADDFYIDNNFLECAKQLMEVQKCDLLIFDLKEYDDLSQSVIPESCRRFPYNIAREHRDHIWDQSERKRYLFEISPFPFTKIYSKDKLLKTNLLYPEHIFYEDCAFSNLASVTFERIIAVSWQPYAYRQNIPGQVTANITKHIEDIVPIHELILKELNERELMLRYDGFAKIKFASIAIRSLVLYFLPQINDFSLAMDLVANIKSFLERLALSDEEMRRLKSIAPDDARVLKEMLKWSPGFLEMSRISIMGMPILLYYRSLRIRKWCLFTRCLTLIKKEELSDWSTKFCVLGIPICVRKGCRLFLFGLIRFGNVFSLRYYSENFNFDLSMRNYLRTRDLSVFK